MAASERRLRQVGPDRVRKVRVGIAVPDLRENVSGMSEVGRAMDRERREPEHASGDPASDAHDRRRGRVLLHEIEHARSHGCDGAQHQRECREPARLLGLRPAQARRDLGGAPLFALDVSHRTREIERGDRYRVEDGPTQVDDFGLGRLLGARFGQSLDEPQGADGARRVERALRVPSLRGLDRHARSEAIVVRREAVSRRTREVLRGAEVAGYDVAWEHRPRPQNA